MRDVGKNLNIPLHVFGPETHMTAIVGMALGKREIPTEAPSSDSATTANFLLPSSVSVSQVCPNNWTNIYLEMIYEQSNNSYIRNVTNCTVSMRQRMF